VFLEQMAKAHHRRLVRHWLATQVDTHERAHRQRVVQRFLDRRIGEAEPQLQTVNAQHALQAGCGSAARARRPRVIRLDELHQLRPWHHRVHFGQELLAARRLTKPLEFVCRKRQLSFQRSTSQRYRVRDSVSITPRQRDSFAEFP